MPPRGRGGRGASAAPAEASRQSSRVAALKEAAQQAAEQAAEQAVAGVSAAEPTIADTPPPPDSSMPPPSSRGARGRGRGRGAEPYARRGTRRIPRAASITSVQSRNMPASTPDYYPIQSDARDPYTPPHATPASSLHYDAFHEPLELTPRTRDATANLMTKFVDRLYSASKDLLSHLAISPEDRDEPWVNELHVHQNCFNIYYRNYSPEADVFIDIDGISERTKAEETPLWPRMTRAVATANLATLLSDVEDLDDNPSNVLNRLPMLQRIDDHFPTSFVPGGKRGLESWVLDGDTIQQAVNIRVQRYIETLRGIPQINTHRLFANVFLDIDADNMTDDMLGAYIDEARIKAFPGFDINGDSAQKYRHLIDSFRSVLTEMDVTAIISKMEDEHPFLSFLGDLKNWVKSFEARVQEPSRPALAYNGDGSYTVDAQLQDDMRASQQVRFTLDGVERLRQHMAAASNGQQAHNSQIIASQTPSFDSFSVADSDWDVVRRAHDMSSQASYYAPGNDGSIYADAAAAHSGKRGGRKRGRKSAADSDPNADETPRGKRARAADSSAMPPPPRRNPGQAAIPVSSMPPPAVPVDVVALSRQSQLISKANRKPPQPKQRRPWTVHDTQQLVRAIDTYKAKWSTIERAIKEQHIAFDVPERDQQGLRDKARLVKVDLLKTDGTLPPSFDLVVLGRKEKEMVIATGRNPERKEDDIINDQPTNTLYDPHASPMNDDIEAAPPVESEAAPEAADDAAIRALQDAHMAPEAPIGGAPDAPMMVSEPPAVAPSESLGETASADADSEARLPDGLQAVPVDVLAEAGPSTAIPTP